MLFRRIGLVMALLLASVSLYAQETTGTVRGRIVDAQGLAIPGVTVTATGAQGAKTTVTDGEGRFNIPFLTPGSYTVRAELQGFKTDRALGRECRSGADARRAAEDAGRRSV